MSHCVAAQSWVKTDGKVTGSAVQLLPAPDSESSDSYALSLTYAYSFDGRQQFGSRYSFFDSEQSTSREVIQSLADSYPVGTKSVCFVNPKAPAESILIRGFTLAAFWGLVPFGILAAVACGSVRLYRRYHAGPPVAQITLPEQPPGIEQVEPEVLAPAVTNQHPQTTRPETDSQDFVLPDAARITPPGHLLVWFCGTSFLAGITSSFGGIGLWFGCIFGAIGSAGLIYWSLACLNPRFGPTLSHRTLVPGRTSTLRWSIPNAKSDLLNRLTLTLVATEYQGSGSGEYDRASVMTSIEVLDARQIDLRSGEVEIKLPPSAMHSLELKTERIYWRLVVRGYIAFWPDIQREFQLTVRPRRYRWDNQTSPASGPLPKPTRAKLSILSSRRNFRPGERVKVDVGWNLATRAEYLELRVVWNSRYSHRAGVVATYRLTTPKEKEVRRVPVTLPEQPYSFVGRYIQIEWAFELVAFPTHESIREVVAIGPGAKRIGADMIRQYWADVRDGTA